MLTAPAPLARFGLWRFIEDSVRAQLSPGTRFAALAHRTPNGTTWTAPHPTASPLRGASSPAARGGVSAARRLRSVPIRGPHPGVHEPWPGICPEDGGARTPSARGLTQSLQGARRSRSGTSRGLSMPLELRSNVCLDWSWVIAEETQDSWQVRDSRSRSVPLPIGNACWMASETTSGLLHLKPEIEPSFFQMVT